MNHARTKQLSPLPPARRQRGASLLEVIAYLGIAAIVVLGAVSLLSSAFGNAQSNRMVEEVVSIRTGVKRLFMAQTGNYGTGDITSQVASAGVMPATLSVTGGTNSSVKNAFGGAVTITAATTDFSITYEGVPKATCVAALSGASGWVSVKGAGTKVDLTKPVTPQEATTTCSGDTNQVVLVSK